MNVAGYIRVSTADQAQYGLSLQAQRDLIERYAKEHDMNLVEIYADEGVSAAKSLEKRTQILRLVADAELHKFQVVLFKDITRWSRNAAQYYKVQERLDEAGVAWIAIEQPYLETVTPTGKFQVGIMLGTAQLEADQTGQRIKFTQEAEIRRGFYPHPAHCAPYGYTTEKVDGHNRLVVDEQKAQKIRELFDEFLLTANATKLGERLGIPHQNLLRTLKNRTYIGEFRGIPNFCEPIVDKEIFDRAQALMVHHAYRGKIHSYIFSGLAVCGFCGAKMVWNCPDDKYPMCRCRTCKNTLTEREMERQVIEEVEPELNDYKLNFVPPKKQPPRKSLEARIERLKELYIDGVIDRDEFDRRRKQIHEAMEIPTVPPDLPLNWKTLYFNLNNQQKNVLWKTVCTAVIVKDKKANIFFESAKVLAERMSMSLDH